MEIKTKLKKATKKVKTTAIEYAAPVVSGVIIIAGVGTLAYVMVKTAKSMRTQVYQPVEDGFYVNDYEVDGMIDAGNKWLEEYRAAEKAVQEGEL